MLVVDDREITQHEDIPAMFAEEKIDIVIERMIAGDYAFLDVDNSSIGIERCHIGNLVQKMHDGELESQLYAMADIYDRIFLLTEGIYDSVDSLLSTYKAGSRGFFRTRVYPHTRWGEVMAYLVRLSDFGIEMLHTPHFKSTISLIAVVYRQLTKPEEERTLFKRIRPVRLPQKVSTNPAIGMLMALCPRLQEKVAVRLINDYGSIYNVLCQDDKDLLKTDGLGKITLARLRGNVGWPVE